MKERLDRRGFLKLAGLGGGAIVLYACSGETATVTPNATELATQVAEQFKDKKFFGNSEYSRVVEVPGFLKVDDPMGEFFWLQEAQVELTGGDERKRPVVVVETLLNEARSPKGARRKMVGWVPMGGMKADGSLDVVAYELGINVDDENQVDFISSQPWATAVIRNGRREDIVVYLGDRQVKLSLEQAVGDFLAQDPGLQVAMAAEPTATAKPPPTEAPTATKVVEAQKVFTAEQVAASSDELLMNASRLVLAGLKENELGYGWVPTEVIRADEGYNYALLTDPQNGEIKGVYNYSEGAVEKVVAGVKKEGEQVLGRVIIVSSKNFEKVTGREVFLNDKIGLSGEAIGVATAQGNLVDYMIQKLAVVSKAKEAFEQRGYYAPGDYEPKEEFINLATEEYTKKILDGGVMPQTWIFVAEATEEDRVIHWGSSDPVAKWINSNSPDTKIYTANLGKIQWERGITYPTTPGANVDPLVLVMSNLLTIDYLAGLMAKYDPYTIPAGMKTLCGVEKPLIGVVSKAECLVMTRPKLR